VNPATGNRYTAEERMRNRLVGRTIKKYPKIMAFEIEDIRPRFRIDTRMNIREEDGEVTRACVYKLMGIVLYNGSGNFGHYIARVIHNDMAYEFDDARCRQIDISGIQNCQTARIVYYEKVE
jgi:ubiquitin C-terminal hydrolase